MGPHPPGLARVLPAPPRRSALAPCVHARSRPACIFRAASCLASASAVIWRWGDDAYRMAGALLQWTDATKVQRQAITELRAAVDARALGIELIRAVWFELPESIEVRPWSALP